MTKLLFIVAVALSVSSTSCMEEIKKNVFVGENETWLLFPHRQFDIFTYTTECSPTTLGPSIEHKQFQTISSFEMNNTCEQIDIFGQPQQTEQKFYFAKLTFDGVCTVYHVNGGKVINFFQYNAERYFSNLLMMNELNVLIWNNKEFMKIQYSLFSKKINTYQMDFPTQHYRECTLNTGFSVWCWKEDQLLFLDFLNDNLKISAFPYNSEPIAQIFPLSPSDNALLICGKGTCNISMIQEKKIVVKETISFEGNVMGGSIHDETNNFVIVATDSVTVYSFNFYQTIDIKIVNFIDFPQGFECAHYDNSVLLTNMIIIQCFDMVGKQKKIIFSKDQLVNEYFAFNPIDRSSYQDCWLSANRNYILLVYDDQVVLKHNNFYYLSLSQQQTEESIRVKCIKSKSVDSKDETYFLITIEPVSCGSYVNQQVSIPNKIIYNEYVNLQLNRYFKASDITSYNFESNCSFIEPFNYSSVVRQSYFSLYNREKCIQILEGGGQLFYRLIQINETLFYLEECLPLNLGYGCQLTDIYDRYINLKIIRLENRFLKFFIENQRLKMQDNKTIVQIFEKDVFNFEISNSVLVVTTSDNVYYNHINNIRKGFKWNIQESDFRYFYQQSTILSLHPNGTVMECIDEDKVIVDFFQVERSEFEKTNENSVSFLPYAIRIGDFLFIITSQTITKKYIKERVILLYVLPFNFEKKQIENIRLTDIYIIIEYQFSGFQIYDINEEAISARVAKIQDEFIMTDIIVLDSLQILIPIQSTTTLIKIERDPYFTIGQFSPKYFLFHEYCNFKMTVERGNETCMSEESREEAFQEFLLVIKYQIEEIDLDVNIELQRQPSQCSNCILELTQENYLGPIFDYQLNDDYYEQFVLTHHLAIQQCLPTDSSVLKGLLEVRFEGDYVSDEVMMMDGSFIYLMNQGLAVISTFNMKETTFCSSYLKIQNIYLIVCDKYFLLTDLNQKEVSYLHNLSISFQSRFSLQLQSQKLSNNQYCIFLLDHNITAHIFKLSLNEKNIQYLNNYQFLKVIDDLKLINGKIIVLKEHHLCIADQKNFEELPTFNDSVVQYCFPLQDFIPEEYSEGYQYEEFLPYFSSNTSIKALVMAKNVDSLHVDIEINLGVTPFAFKILNAYAGYRGYSLIDVVSVNKTEDSYSYFILLYQRQQNSDQMIAYYKYNSRYLKERIIGQIRSAEFLENYFNQPFNITFAPFSSQLYLTNNNQQIPHSNFQKKKICLSVKVKDELEIVLNYNQIPPLKFLILEARNLNQMATHFIRINFILDGNQLWKSCGCLAVVLILFVGLVVSTNRCKTTDSELEADMFFQEVNISGSGSEDRSLDSIFPCSKSSQSESNEDSSLLHSKDFEYVPPNQVDDSSQEIVIIRGDE